MTEDPGRVSAAARGLLSSRTLVEEALERASDSAGEGARVFVGLDAGNARRGADAIDSSRNSGARLSAIAGLPVSVKDLFDIEGQVTTAGSPALQNAPTAVRDSTVVARLKAAGAVIVGRTNMSEFAFTGVGMNPYYGTPANPFDRATRRIPGGSSSGAGVSVTDGMAMAAIGSDTGGSVRIPAALCGIVGFKPTQKRIPLDGVFPLSSTLDSVGVLAGSVETCAAFDAVLAAEAPWELIPADLRSITAAVPRNYFLDDLEPPVADALARALTAMSAAGARVVDAGFPEVAAIGAVNAMGGFAAAEAYPFHHKNSTDAACHDPLVRERILRGASIGDSVHSEMARRRASIIRDFADAHATVDVIVCPVVPLIAPAIGALERDPDEFRRVNALLLRNPSVVNFLDRCALSLPCHRPGDAPVGLMLIGRHAGDHTLLSIGAAVERLLAAANGGDAHSICS